MYDDYKKLLRINDKLLTKILKQEDIDNFKDLFNNLKNKPKLSLLGQSGAGKSTLINKIVGEPILESSSGKGAVTQYPVELIYDTDVRFYITKSSDIKQHELIAILKDKIYVSEYHEELLNDNELLIEIYRYIDSMNNMEIPFKQKYLWKDFNKKINGNENGKYHFEYKTTINDEDINIWINVSPFIKKLSIYLNCELLEKVSLVDLPGLYDKSEVRTRKTKEYLDKETDFIMIVENNDRAATSEFIEKSLNSYIVNVIVKKQIPDILLTLTNIDRTYESSIKEVGGESDDEDDEEIMENAKIEFEERLENTKNKITEDIHKNESLKIHGITSENINILFYSSKKKINTVLNKNTVEDVKNSILDICRKRTKRYSSIIVDLIKDHYNDIKSYVNKESIQEEEVNKIKEMLTNIKQQIINDIIIKIEHPTLLITDGEFNRILVENENYSNRLRNSEETHGLTLWAVLRKLNHKSNDGEEYNVIDDLSEEYMKSWNEMYIDFVKNMNNLFYENIKNIDEMNSFKKLKDINDIDSDEIVKLKKRIKKVLVRGGEEMKINNERYCSYEKYLQSEGSSIIGKNIYNNVVKYKLLAQQSEGGGVANTCRGYISEMLSIPNNIIVKENINKEMIEILKNINDINQTRFLEKLDHIFYLFSSQFEGDGIDVDGINEILDSMDTELYNSSDESVMGAEGYIQDEYVIETEHYVSALPAAISHADEERLAEASKEASLKAEHEAAAHEAEMLRQEAEAENMAAHEVDALNVEFSMLEQDTQGMRDAGGYVASDIQDAVAEERAATHSDY